MTGGTAAGDRRNARGFLKMSHQGGWEYKKLRGVRARGGEVESVFPRQQRRAGESAEKIRRRVTGQGKERGTCADTTYGHKRERIAFCPQQAYDASRCLVRTRMKKNKRWST